MIETIPKYKSHLILVECHFNLANTSQFLEDYKAAKCASDDLELASVVPEKAYNYEEFQEPLVAIGQH